MRIRCSVLVLPTRDDGSIANPFGDTIVQWHADEINCIEVIEALNETTLSDVKVGISDIALSGLPNIVH